MAKEPSDLVVCVDNSGYEAALERRKLYALLPDSDAELRGLLRVVDESGDQWSDAVTQRDARERSLCHRQDEPNSQERSQLPGFHPRA